MRSAVVRRSLWFAAAFLILSVSWMPSSSRTAPPSVAVSLALPLPGAGAVLPQLTPVDPQKLALALANPNAAEYFYQQALLHLGRDEKAQAVELLRIYAQSGRNPRQIARAQTLIAQIAP